MFCVEHFLFNNYHRKNKFVYFKIINFCFININFYSLILFLSPYNVLRRTLYNIINIII